MTKEAYCGKKWTQQIGDTESVWIVNLLQESQCSWPCRHVTCATHAHVALRIMSA